MWCLDTLVIIVEERDSVIDSHSLWLNIHDLLPLPLTRCGGRGFMFPIVGGAANDSIYLPVTVLVPVASSGLICSFILGSSASILVRSSFFPVVVVVVSPSSPNRSLCFTARVAIYVLFQVPSLDCVLNCTF